MAIKMKNVLNCIFVFVILMSLISISVFAMDDNKTKDQSVNFNSTISNHQNETVRILANSEKKIILPVPYYSQGYTYWCALTSISMLANYLRRTNVYHPWDIAEALGKDKWDGLRRNWLISYFDEASRVVTDIEPSVEIKKWKKEKSNEALQYILDMIKQDQPVILCLWGEKHAIVVVGYELDQNNPDNPWIFIHDPDQVLNSVLKNYHLELPLIAERVKWSDIANLMAGLLEEDVTYTAKMPNPNLKDQYMPSGTINLEDGSVNILGEDGGIILIFDEGLQWKADNRPLYVVSPIGMGIHFYIANQYEVEKSYKVLITMDDQVLTSDQVNVKKRNWTACSYTYPFFDISSGEHTLSIGIWETLQEYPHLIPCDLVDFPPFEVKSPQSSDFTPLDLCMVLDKSGSMDESMGDKTRMQGVKEAAKGVVNVLLPQDRVSIVSFSDTATANIDLTSNFNAVKTKINAITADGGTSFGAGLDTALDQFNTFGNPDHTPAILFMSDGEHNRAPDPEAYVTQCKNKGIPIFTVGFASSESEVDVTKLKKMAEETGGEYHFVSEIFDLQNIFLRLQHKASGWESVAAYVGEVDEGETITAGTFYVDPAIDDLRVTLNWAGSNLDLELFDPSGRQVDFGASNVVYSGDTKPEYVIIKDPQSGTWTAKVYGKSIGSSEEFFVLVTKYVPEPTMDIQAEIRNIWTSDIISPIVLFGKNANLGQVLQADLDDDSFSDPLPSYDDRCLGDKNYDKSVISRFGEGDDKVRMVLDITGGTGFKPGSEGYIKILNPEYKITKIYEHSDYVGVQPPTMSLGTPTISTDYSGFGVVIDMEEGCVSWQGRGTCPACACRENTFRMEFLVEKVSIPADSVVIFADNFDTYATGSFPSSGAWNLKYNGMGDSYQVVDNTQSVSSPNSFKLEGEANWAASADHPLAETPDQVIYEVDVKVTQPGSSVMNYHDAAIGLANPNIGTWGTRYAGVIFGNAENRVIQPGNSPFNFDQWYHLKVEADMNNGVYDVWLDDQLIASNISTSSNGDYTDIRLEGGNNAHTRVWFDNVKVYRGDYPSQDPNGGLKEIPDRNTITNTIGMEFVPIPPGKFGMGSPSDEEDMWSAEGPIHHVNIGKAFYMGRYEVTQKQWRAIMGDNPSRFTGDDLPVEQVSWYDVQEFIKKLNEKEGTDKYRLPSEAEWEYACRAGTTTRYSFGNSESNLGEYAWYDNNSRDKTHPVGQKKPNSWELYDLYGNVRE